MLCSVGLFWQFLDVGFCSGPGILQYLPDRELFLSIFSTQHKLELTSKWSYNDNIQSHYWAPIVWNDNWCISFFLDYFWFLWPHLWHLEVPRLEVESEWHLPAYAIATATQDPSHVCNLHHSSQQHRIQAGSVTYNRANSNARSLTHWARPGIKPASSWILVGFVNCWAMKETPELSYM